MVVVVVVGGDDYDADEVTVVAMSRRCDADVDADDDADDDVVMRTQVVKAKAIHAIKFAIGSSQRLRVRRPKKGDDPQRQQQWLRRHRERVR